MKKKLFISIISLIVLAACGTGYYYLFASDSWATYINGDYGYEIRHPKDWTVSQLPSGQEVNDLASGKITSQDLSNSTISFEKWDVNKIKYYSLIISVEENPRNLSAQQYVEDLIEKDRLAKEEGERVLNEYEGYRAVNISEYDGYEIYGLLAGDYAANVIYLAQEDYIYQLKFPINEENENLLEPMTNHEVVEKMLTSFKM